MKIKIATKIIISISSIYNDVNRIFLEYIDNSLDSAEALFDRASNSYSKQVDIKLIIKGRRHTNGKVLITDNCVGIESLEQVCGSIGDSEKKEQPWTNGQFGYGIFSYMATCKNLKIISKQVNSDAYSIEIPKETFDVSDVEDVKLEDMKKDKYENNSGTLIELSGFDKCSSMKQTKI